MGTDGDRPVVLAVDLLDEQLVGQLVDRARASGLQLTGEGGLLHQLTKRVLESALEGEITDHLGYGEARQGRGRQRQQPQRRPGQDRSGWASIQRQLGRTFRPSYGKTPGE